MLSRATNRAFCCNCSQHRFAFSAATKHRGTHVNRSTPYTARSSTNFEHHLHLVHHYARIVGQGANNAPMGFNRPKMDQRPAASQRKRPLDAADAKCLRMLSLSLAPE